MPRTLQQSCTAKSSLQYGVALVLTVTLFGCGDTQEESPDPAQAEAQIRAALPEAAGIPIDEFDEIWSPGKAPPGVTKLTNQPLSHLLAGFGRPIPDASLELLDGEFLQFQSTVDPDKIARTISVSRDKGYASVLQPDNIEQLTCKVSEKAAKGRVAFTVKDWCRAKVDYVATFESGKWSITEFALPTWRVKTIRQDDGTWRASGEGLYPTTNLSLPSVRGLAPREDSPNRLVIAIGYPPEMKRPSIADLGFAISGKRATQTEFGELLSAASHDLAEKRTIRRQQMIVVIRPDWSVPAGLIRWVVAQLRAESFEQIRLVGSIRGGRQQDARAYDFPGEVAVTMLDTRPVTGNYDESIHVRLKPDNRGELDSIEIKTPLENFTCDDVWDMQEHLLEYSNGGAIDFEVVFDVDDGVIYRSLLRALSAAAGYYNEERKWISIASELQLLPSALNSQ